MAVSACLRPPPKFNKKGESSTEVLSGLCLIWSARAVIKLKRRVSTSHVFFLLFRPLQNVPRQIYGVFSKYSQCPSIPRILPSGSKLGLTLVRHNIYGRLIMKSTDIF